MKGTEELILFSLKTDIFLRFPQAHVEYISVSMYHVSPFIFTEHSVCHCADQIRRWNSLSNDLNDQLSG